jgi:hypothetical protein
MEVILHAVFVSACLTLHVLLLESHGLGLFRLVLMHGTWHATTLPTIQILDILVNI